MVDIQFGVYLDEVQLQYFADLTVDLSAGFFGD